MGADRTARELFDNDLLGPMERIAGTESLTGALAVTLVLANILAVVSGLLCALFLLGMLNPPRLVMLARRFIGGTGVAGPVTVRLLLAVLLWFSAPVASTPATFRTLALVMVMAAVGALVFGKDRAARLADGMAGRSSIVVRIPIAIGLALCAFILWSISSAISVF